MSEYSSTAYTMVVPFLGLLSVFAYTGGFGFVINLVSVLKPDTISGSEELTPLKQRIKGYYIFSDFVLDSLFFGGLFAILPVVIFMIDPKSWQGPVRFLVVLWIIILILLFYSWYSRYHDFASHELCANELRGFHIISKFCLALTIGLAEGLVIYRIFFSSDEDLFRTIIISKVSYLFCWIILGLIWKPLSAYVYLLCNPANEQSRGTQLRHEGSEDITETI